MTNITLKDAFIVSHAINDGLYEITVCCRNDNVSGTIQDGFHLEVKMGDMPEKCLNDKVRELKAEADKAYAEFVGKIPYPMTSEQKKIANEVFLLTQEIKDTVAKNLVIRELFDSIDEYLEAIKGEWHMI